MRRNHTLTFTFIMLLATIAWAQQKANPTTQQPTNSQQSTMLWGGVLYDDFNSKWLDPAKWAAVPEGATPNFKEACYYSTNVLECVREIQNGRLRLAVRSYGARDSDQGTQYGESKLLFGHPQFVKSITADVVVRNISARMCPANFDGSFALPQAMITATFFNSGSGDSNDNVSGILTLQPISANDLRTIVIRGFIGWQFQYFGFVDLGSVPVGTPVRATLRWNQSSHKFVVSFENLVTHQFFTADVPYSMPDTMEPIGDWKGLYVQAFPSNCINAQTSEHTEATFDNVIISR